MIGLFTQALRFSGRFRMEVQSGSGFYNRKGIFRHCWIIPLKLELVSCTLNIDSKEVVVILKPSNLHSSPRFVPKP